MWVGALMGAIVVFTITFAGPKLGTATTIGLLIAGQVATGAAIDRYGLFGLDRIALHWRRRRRHFAQEVGERRPASSKAAATRAS
jgi:uncharacterized membrane protein YdcZ (DUF606 family)